MTTDLAEFSVAVGLVGGDGCSAAPLAATLGCARVQVTGRRLTAEPTSTKHQHVTYAQIRVRVSERE